MSGRSDPSLPRKAAGGDLDQGTSLGHDAWLRLRKNRLAVAGGLLLAVIAVLFPLAAACSMGPWAQRACKAVAVERRSGMGTRGAAANPPAAQKSTAKVPNPATTVKPIHSPMRTEAEL